MLLCHRGCGLEATFTNTLGEPCCFPKAPSCPIIKKKIGEKSGASRKGKTYEELHGDNADAMRKKRSKGLTGRTVSEKSRKKSSQFEIQIWSKRHRIASGDTICK